jgi:hypothetical protein
MKEIKEKLTQETLDSAWVLKRQFQSCRVEFDLRCNKCKQFPKGFYDRVFVKTAKEAKNLLYEKLMSELDGLQ